ncbi:hypothetical protein KC361_g4349 [Hortaea werneckii]|nr:hypothetical protein KC361_g4349 [Hortaea werneckii]
MATTTSGDYNSDDLQFSPRPSPQKNHGKRSIEKMLASAETDRVESKRVVKQLRYEVGAPSTRYSQSLWTQRFQAFREGVLKQDNARAFTSDDLIRFLASIVGKLQLMQNKPAPNLTTIKSAIKFLHSYGIFTWREFSWTKHDSSRVRAWLDQTVRNKQLVRGTWQKKTYVGFAVLSRLVRAYLRHTFEQGCGSFDIVVAKVLSVVLISSLGARAGDVARSLHASAEQTLQFRHITLSIQGEEPRFENLVATIELEFTKGFKDTRNHSRMCYLRPLNEASSNHVCPIALLLVHCLRHGLVEGTTIQQILQNAWQRSDRAVVWLFPNRPVLPSFHPPRCELDRPATVDQVANTLKAMAIVSGMVSRIQTHALRAGHAEEVASLPSHLTDGQRTSLDVVRQSLGHTYKSLHAGVTENYVGGLVLEAFNLRAAHPVHSRKAPSFTGVETGEGGKRAQARKALPQDAGSKLGLPEGVSQQQTMEMLADPSPTPHPPTAHLLSLPPDPQKKTAGSVPLRTARVPLTPKDPNIPSATMLATSSAETDWSIIDPAILSEEELETAAARLNPETVEELEAVV